MQDGMRIVFSCPLLLESVNPGDTCGNPGRVTHPGLLTGWELTPICLCFYYAKSRREKFVLTACPALV